MKILILADIHSKKEKLKDILKNIDISDIDLILSPGDFTDMYSYPIEFSQMDMAILIIQKLVSLKKPLFCVPGNQDPYEILNIFDEFGINLHENIKKMNNLYFLGFGGAQTPFGTKFEPLEEEMKNALENMVKRIKGDFVLLVHNPPKNTKLDIVMGKKHVGSKIVREFIEKYKPILTISAHIHESPGIDKIGETILFYPGPVIDGKYGIVDIDKKIRCEIKSID